MYQSDITPDKLFSFHVQQFGDRLIFRVLYMGTVIESHELSLTSN